MIVHGTWAVFTAPVYNTVAVTKSRCSNDSTHIVKKTHIFCSVCGSPVIKEPVMLQQTITDVWKLPKDISIFISNNKCVIIQVDICDLLESGYLSEEQRLVMTSSPSKGYFCILVASSLMDKREFDYTGFGAAIIPKQDVSTVVLNDTLFNELTCLFKEAASGGDLVGMVDMLCFIDE